MKIKLNGITVNELASYLSVPATGSPKTDGIVLSSICTDSREVEQDCVFVAIRGENTDGHKYMDKAVSGGAVCIICEELPIEPYASCAYLLVPSSEKALSIAASAYRIKKCHDLCAIAVTGSVGKTTLKELVYSAVSSQKNVYKTDGNYNSTIGMPISLLGMSCEYSYAVFEMGMSGLGEISSMSLAAKPKVAVITNVGHSHLEYLKTRENILKAKLEVTDGLQSDGYLVINADDEMLSKANLDKYPFNIVKCSLKNEKSDYFAFNIRFTENQSMLFDYTHAGKTYYDVEVGGVGEHFVISSLSAIAAAEMLGISPESSISGIRNFKNASMRQNIVNVNGYTVVEDCYNAAPESMRAAINALVRLSKTNGGRAFAVLGDMKELGDNSEQLHSELGEYAVKSGVDVILTVGDLSVNINGGAINAGLDASCSYHFTSSDECKEIAQTIDSMMKKSDVLLVKASRSIKAERIVEAFKELKA